MDHAKHSADLKDVRKRSQALSALAGVLSVSLLLCLVAIVKLIGTERTVVVPPTLNKSFWVTTSKASASYLEQMGIYVAWLILDVSPSTIDWKKDELLTWVAPEQHGAFKVQQEVEAERLKRMNATTYLQPLQFVPDETTQSVVVRGRLKTQVNGQETSTDTKSYLVQFDYEGGRIHLQGFKEISNDPQAPSRASAGDDGARAN